MILSTSEKKVYKKLKEVMDPELHISIVDLGLIYNIRVDKNCAVITMTLTSMGCPLYPIIKTQIEQTVATLPIISHVTIILVFDPPWSINKMSKKGRVILGI